MKTELTRILDKDEIEQIHGATLNLLSEYGVKVESEDAITIFKQNGAEIDYDNQIVKIPEELIIEMIKKVPNSFKIHGPDGNFNFELNTKNTTYATIGTPTKMYDYEKKKTRRSKLKDFIDHLRIVDVCENISCSHVDVWANDVPLVALHAHCILHWYKNTRKPFGSGTYLRLPSQDMMDMTSLIVGGEKNLIENPRLVGFFNPTSPLSLPKMLLNGLFVWAKYKQPVIVAPEALAGATAPVTLAGLLVQANAEVLSTAVLMQLIESGSPLFYGTVSTAIDMKTGNICLGSVETGLVTAAVSQLGNFYNIPTRGPGLMTESKLLDFQNGFERALTLLMAAQSGINYITCAGTMESTTVESLELLLLDDELCGIIQRSLEGIKVNEETIALDLIKEVGIGGNYLGKKHTIQNLNKELFIPKYFDRNKRSKWKKLGSKSIIDIVQEKVVDVLDNYMMPETDKNIENQLEKMVKKIEKRTIDFYKSEEGVSEDSTGLINE
jgi:trimethylamine--corrinoid protein Co-methyltransferase